MISTMASSLFLLSLAAASVVTASQAISTVIPCAVDGPVASTTTVTCLDQPITVSKCTSTATSVVQSTQTVYTTYYKEWMAPYQAIGDLAISGYGGSGLCKACEANDQGIKAQFLNVSECYTCGEEETCVGYPEVWIQQPVKPAKDMVTAVCQSTVTVTAPGTYTWTFMKTAPPKTINIDECVETITLRQGGYQTNTIPATTTICPAQPYYAIVTQVCGDATTIILDATITQEISYNYAMQTGRPADWLPNQGGWNDWYAHSPQPAPVGWNDWQGPAPVQGWNNWYGSSTLTATAAAMTTTAATIVTPPFIIYAQTGSSLGSRFAKRDILGYVNFINQNAVIDPQLSNADTFTIDSNRFMFSEGFAVGSTSLSANLPMQELSGTPAGPHLWNRAANGKLTVDSSTGFCFLNSVVQILINQSPPSGCVPVDLYVGPAPASTSTSASSAAAATSQVVTATNSLGNIFTYTTNANTAPSYPVTNVVITSTNSLGNLFTFTSAEILPPSSTATGGSGGTGGAGGAGGVVVTTTNGAGVVFTGTVSAPTTTATAPACFNGQNVAPVFTLQVSAANILTINGVVLGQDGTSLRVGLNNPASDQFTFNTACNIVNVATGDVIVPGANGQAALVVSPSTAASQGLSPAVCSISATSDLVCNGGNQFSVPLNSGTSPLVNLDSTTVPGGTGNAVIVKAQIGGTSASTTFSQTTTATPSCFTAGIAPVFTLAANVNNPAGLQLGKVVSQGTALDIDVTGAPATSFTFDTLCRLVDTATRNVAAVTPQGLQLVDPASNPTVSATCNLLAGVLQCSDQNGAALNFVANTATGTLFPLGVGSNVGGTSVVLNTMNGGATTTTSSSAATSSTAAPCAGRAPFRLQVGPGSSLTNNYLTPNTGVLAVTGEVTFATSTNLLFKVDDQCNVSSNSGNPLLVVGVQNVAQKLLVDSTGVAGAVGVPCKIDPSTNVFSCNNDPRFFAIPAAQGVTVVGLTPASNISPLIQQITLKAV